jgi:hypothetical protein
MLKKLFTGLLISGVMATVAFSNAGSASVSISNESIVGDDEYGQYIYSRNITVDVNSLDTKTIWNKDVDANSLKQHTITQMSYIKPGYRPSGACDVNPQWCSGNRPFLVNEGALTQDAKDVEIVFQEKELYQAENTLGFYPLRVDRGVDYYNRGRGRFHGGFCFTFISGWMNAMFGTSQDNYWDRDSNSDSYSELFKTMRKDYVSNIVLGVPADKIYKTDDALSLLAYPDPYGNDICRDEEVSRQVIDFTNPTREKESLIKFNNHKKTYGSWRGSCPSGSSRVVTKSKYGGLYKEAHCEKTIVETIPNYITQSYNIEVCEPAEQPKKWRPGHFMSKMMNMGKGMADHMMGFFMGFNVFKRSDTNYSMNHIQQDTVTSILTLAGERKKRDFSIRYGSNQSGIWMFNMCHGMFDQFIGLFGFRGHSEPEQKKVYDLADKKLVMAFAETNGFDSYAGTGFISGVKYLGLKKLEFIEKRDNNGEILCIEEETVRGLFPSMMKGMMTMMKCMMSFFTQCESRSAAPQCLPLYDFKLVGDVITYEVGSGSAAYVPTEFKVVTVGNNGKNSQANGNGKSGESHGNNGK